MNSVKKVAMIIIMQNDLETGIDFYKKLGLTLVFQVKDSWAEFKLNDLSIGLCPTTEKLDYHRTNIVLAIDDLPAFYEAHKDSLSFLDKPVQASHGFIASIKDPSGNIVDLYQATEQKTKGCGDACACDSQMPENSGCCKQPDNQTSTCC